MPPIDSEFAPLDGALPSGWSVPRPNRQPASVPAAPPKRLGRWLFLGVVVAAVVVAAWTLRRDWIEPTPPVHEGVAVGRTLAPALSEALAKGFDAAATLIESGQSIKMADDTLKSTFDTERKAAFGKIGGPFLGSIVKSGEEPKDEAQRQQFAEAHRAIARGLRGTR